MIEALGLDAACRNAKMQLTECWSVTAFLNAEL